MASPYRQEDWVPWACLLLDAFGTRSPNVATAFMTNLRDMCPDVVGEDRRSKDPFAFEQAIAIVASLRPETEAEAAHAAGMVAVHLATMKVAADLGSRSYIDPRMARTLSSLARTYSGQMQAMRSRKVPRPKAQVIKVQKQVTVNYDNRQVHLSGGGANIDDRQPHATDQLRARARGAAEPIECTALPCSNKSRVPVSVSSGEGSEALPASRIGQGLRRSEGASERELQARRLHHRGDQPPARGGGAPETDTGGAE
jgi:hypothetical protein